MTSYFRYMFFAILCVSMAACVLKPEIYTHPSIPDADDSEVAIFEDISGLRRIEDADGNEIPYLEGLPPTEYRPRVEIRLPPGNYHIYYQGWTRGGGNNRVTLEAGHLYEVGEEYCAGFILEFFSCLFRMEAKSTDAWIEDVTTGERIAGCRQGLGCIPNSW